MIIEATNKIMPRQEVKPVGIEKVPPVVKSQKTLTEKQENLYA